MFSGKRLKVSASQHQVLLDECGPRVNSWDWPALYAAWDTDLVATGEEFDTLLFIKHRAALAVELASRVRVDESPEADWFSECQQLHDGKCGGRFNHGTRMRAADAQGEVPVTSGGLP